MGADMDIIRKDAAAAADRAAAVERELRRTEGHPRTVTRTPEHRAVSSRKEHGADRQIQADG